MTEHSGGGPLDGILLSDDLLFTSRILGEARALGLGVRPARTVEVLQALVRSQPPSCVIADLSNPGLIIADLLGWLNEECDPVPRVIAYGSHVDSATLRAARAAGCSEVLPRSQFVEVLPNRLASWMSASRVGDA
jgi:DNA-binding NarL/FixJ family response regulator